MILAKLRKSTLYDLLAPPLILVTPFISFVNYNDYNYAAPELWLCLAGLVALGLLCGAIMALGGTWLRILGTAALVTLFVDFQSEWFDDQPGLWVPTFALGAMLACWALRANLSHITTPIFATMLVSTVALHALGGAASSGAARIAPTGIELAPENELPTIVHIVLDEHIGIEGIPADVEHGPETKAQLKFFFQSYGFRLFGHAYSRYARTRDSIPNMLNYTSRPLRRAWVHGGRNEVMEANRYFEDMHRLGYEIHALQVGFLDLCASSAQIIASCYTVDHTGIKSLEDTKISLGAKTILIYRLYARLSAIDNGLSYLNAVVRVFAERHGWDWPEWWSDRLGMSALRATHTMSLLAKEVARSRSGQLFFAHLLMPHSPYIYNANCDERDPADWEPAYDRAPLPPNTTQARTQRYALHLEQVQCLYTRLDGMFRLWQEAGVFDRAKIIIHGDHGSRIWLHRPVASNREAMQVSDYADAFSTLLAIKAPGYEPGYDLRWIAIQDLLPELATQGRPRQIAQEGSAHLRSSSDQRPYVFLEGDDLEEPMVKQPLPGFGVADRVVTQRGAQ
jgi:hypothetical protein